MSQSVSILLSYRALEHFIASAIQDIQVPSLGDLKIGKLQLRGDSKEVLLSMHTEGFFDGQVQIKGIPLYDKAQESLYFRLDDLDMDSDSILQRMGSSMSKPFIVKKLNGLLRISKKELLDLIGKQLDDGIKSAFSEMKINPSISASFLDISNVFCTHEGLEIKGDLGLQIRMI